MRQRDLTYEPDLRSEFDVTLLRRIGMSPSEQKAGDHRPLAGPVRQQAEVSQHFGRSIQLTITADIITQATPYQQAQAQHAAKQKEVKESLAQDPLLQGLLSTFDASVEKIIMPENENH